MLETVLKDRDLTGEMFITTAKAANICKVMTGEDWNPNPKHIRCFADTINSAVQNELKITRVAKILASLKKLLLISIEVILQMLSIFNGKQS